MTPPVSAPRAPSRPLVRHLASAPRLRVLAERATVLLGGEDTDGRLSMVLVESAPGGFAPPHLHTREAETFTVLEGRYRFVVDGRVVDAPRWTTVHAPIGVPHAYALVGDEPGRLLVVTTPSGLDEFFRDLDALDLPMPPPPEALAEVARRHGVRLLPPGATPDARAVGELPA